MDFLQPLLLQAVTGVPNLPAPDPRSALDIGFGVTFAKTMTDILKGSWGGDLRKAPPWGVMVAGAFVFGIVGVALSFAMTGHNPLDNLAAVFGHGQMAGAGAVGATAIHKDVRPAVEPALVAEVARPPEQIAETAPELHSAPPIPPEVETLPLQVAPPPLQVSPEPSIRERVIAAAASYEGVPYVWGGKDRAGVDCSGYTWAVMKDVGLPFPEGVRTAEQQRQFCAPVPWHEVEPGDLVFMHHTYEPDEAPGPDGFVASHIGISLGRGTFQIWDANNTAGSVGITKVNTPYWTPKMLAAGRHPQLPAAPHRTPPAAPGALLRGIDVASYQPADLSALIAETGAQHVVVKLYQQVERIGGRLTGRQHSLAQIASALASGASVGGYVWGYAERDPAVTVRDALSVAQEAGVTLPVLWLDIEPYTDGSLPSSDWIRAALAECEAQGVRAGIYSGAWVWPRLGNPAFPDVPLWTAIYDGNPALDVPAYGGMRLVAKQFGTVPCDTNVFLPEVTR